ncbi:Fibronectin type III domain-containing protein [Aphelenchoides besseyi]|nr:Fibronectin type III domain-containing protein [Aphelenchoides besseyi]
MMGGGNATTATAIAISNSVPSPSAVWSQSFPGATMEVIPEEETQSDGVHSPREHQTTSSTSRIERTQRKREVFTSEQVDTLVSTLAGKDVPLEWRDLPTEEIVNDPIMAHTYVTQLPGQTSARSTRKTYTYETHMDDPDSTALDNTTTYSEEDKYSHSTQKVTRVTKITTTRSIKQIPVDPADIYFDADGNPLSNGVDRAISEYDYDNAGIDLSHSCITEHEEVHQKTPIEPSTSAVPSAPPQPNAILTDENDILLSWSPPDHSGIAGEILGYLVEFRRSEDDNWMAAHDELLVDNECKVSKLEDLDYRFRVSAANCAGFGPSSPSSHPISPRKSGAPPNNLRVLNVDADRVVLEWNSPQSIAPNPSYLIEYRNRPTQSWRLVNEHPVSRCRFEAGNLRPNEDYEFRVLMRYEDGSLSEPSQTTGFLRTRPSPPERRNDSEVQQPGKQTTGQFNPSITRPGQPQVIASDSTYVRLRWSPSTNSDRNSIAYLVEVKEVNDPTWFVVGPEPIASNEFIADNLQSTVGYVFRVSAMATDGTQSAPSPESEVIRLSELHQNNYSKVSNPNEQSRLQGQPPERPQPPEYLDFDGGNSVSICWLPAKSTLPVLGYEVEFRDVQQDPNSWYKVTDHLIRSCKTTVGYLIHQHEYQFRLIAKNANGFSEPSDPSPLITIEDTKYLEAERHAAVSLLQDEMIRESPPLLDRDDSPPPMYRQSDQSNLQWRDPTLKEVIDYLKSNDEDVVLDASGYLQHLTFNNDLIKEDTRKYDGIPLLIRLLQHRNSEVVRNACGSLKNLAFGRGNDVNKKEIYSKGGVKALGQVLKTTSNVHVREEATGALWNISSSDDLKEPVFHQVADVVVQYVVVPSSGLLNSQPAEHAKHGTATVFRNGTGILRNVSAATPETRKLLRVAPNLIEALLFALRTSIQRRQVDTRSVENIVCILRNLSYRVQEVVDPKYNPRAAQHSSRERSKSTPPFSPKSKKKSNNLFKKNKKENSPSPTKVTGPQLLWHDDTVELYLRVLQESADPEILEASGAAIQNLAACQFDGSIQVRTAVRALKGLPILVELLKLRDDKVVCAVVTALRNLCIDHKNLELVGRNAMKDLVIKLPEPGQQSRDPHISDATIGAVLGIFWEIVKSSLELTRVLHENGGTDRLRALAKSYPMYGKRVCKYATQVLYFEWQHKEMQDVFRRIGLRDADFYSGTINRRAGRSQTPGVDIATLRRPISSQGNERPAHLRSETADESTDSVRYGAFDSASPSTGRASSARFAEQSPMTPNSERAASARPKGNLQSPNEPVYASVYKRNGHRGSVGGDSWV